RQKPAGLTGKCHEGAGGGVRYRRRGFGIILFLLRVTHTSGDRCFVVLVVFEVTGDRFTHFILLPGTIRVTLSGSTHGKTRGAALVNGIQIVIVGTDDPAQALIPG